jgi:hypothetical protein
MLAIAGLIAFIIAAILELVKTHISWVVWLIIIGGILICAHAVFGYWGTRRGNPVA